MKLLANWRLIVIGLVALAVGGYVLHCEHAKSRLAKAAALAIEQSKENARQALRDLKAKERTDEEYKRRIARLSFDLGRLRNNASLLPAAPAASVSPQLACFDRALVDRALRDYREGVIGLLGEGAAAIEGLDEAKLWAQGRDQALPQ